MAVVVTLAVTAAVHRWQNPWCRLWVCGLRAHRSGCRTESGTDVAFAHLARRQPALKAGVEAEMPVDWVAWASLATGRACLPLLLPQPLLQCFL